MSVLVADLAPLRPRSLDVAHGHLGLGLPADGGPLDPQLAFAGSVGDNPPCTGETFDLSAALTRTSYPVVVVFGDRDRDRRRRRRDHAFP